MCLIICNFRTGKFSKLFPQFHTEQEVILKQLQDKLIETVKRKITEDIDEILDDSHLKLREKLRKLDHIYSNSSKKQDFIAW